MTLNTLLIITFIMLLFIYYLAFRFNNKVLFFIGGLLWFVPIVNIEDPFIKVVSTMMLIMSGVIAFYNGNNGGEY